MLFATLEDEQVFHHRLCMGMIYLSPIVFLFLRYIFPPNWGKTYQTLLGPTVPPRIGWCLFEIPNLVWAAVCYRNTDKQLPLANTLLLGLFVGHYLNRSLVYPFVTLNPHSKPLPLEIVLSAHLYTHINGYVQSQALCQFVSFPENYVTSPQFLVGIGVFVTGVAINWQSDHILTNLRSKSSSSTSQSNNNNNTQYVIPHGGLFRFVSNPHYFGELLEWTGFAVACHPSAAAWSFVTFSAANLIPRAVAHHQWYLDKFQEDYPPLHRKAVIPFVW